MLIQGVSRTTELLSRLKQGRRGGGIIDCNCRCRSRGECSEIHNNLNAVTSKKLEQVVADYYEGLCRYGSFGHLKILFVLVIAKISMSMC